MKKSERIAYLLGELEKRNNQIVELKVVNTGAVSTTEAESMRRHIKELEAACSPAEPVKEGDGQQLVRRCAKEIAENFNAGRKAEDIQRLIEDCRLHGLIEPAKEDGNIPEGLCVRDDVLLWNGEPVKSVEVTLSNAKSGYTIASWTSGVYMHERIMGWGQGRCKVVVATTKDRLEVPCNACGEVRK